MNAETTVILLWDDNSLVNIYPDLRDMMGNLGNAYTVSEDYNPDRSKPRSYSIHKDGASQRHWTANETTLIWLLNYQRSQAQKALAKATETKEPLPTTFYNPNAIGPFHGMHGTAKKGGE